MFKNSLYTEGSKNTKQSPPCKAVFCSQFALYRSCGGASNYGDEGIGNDPTVFVQLDIPTITGGFVNLKHEGVLND